MFVHRRAQAQKRTEIDLMIRLHIWLILCIETAYNNENKTKQTLPGKKENLISRVTILLLSNVQLLIKKIIKSTKKQKSMAFSKEEQINRNCF